MKHVPLDDVVLTSGGHTRREDGTCLMEAVAYYAGEAHSDHPKCVCPVLTEIGMGLNDTLPDEKRVRLLQYVPKLVGTDDDGMSEARGFARMVALSPTSEIRAEVYRELVPEGAMSGRVQ